MEMSGGRSLYPLLSQVPDDHLVPPGFSGGGAVAQQPPPYYETSHFGDLNKPQFDWNLIDHRQQQYNCTIAAPSSAGGVQRLSTGSIFRESSISRDYYTPLSLSNAETVGTGGGAAKSRVKGFGALSGGSGRGYGGGGSTWAQQTQESYQLRLARLSSEASCADEPNFVDPVLDEAASLSSASNVSAEAVSYRFWVSGCLSYYDKVPDGFYFIRGMDPFVGTVCTNLHNRGRMPSIESLRAVDLRNVSALEVILIDRRSDLSLNELQNRIRNLSFSCTTLKEVVEHLTKLVCNRMGGAASSGEDILLPMWKERSDNIKHVLGSVVLPIGSLSVGLCRHRALLFKVLADTIDLPCRIARGCKYCTRDDASSCLVQLGLDREYLVDLVGNPGCLTESNSVLNGPSSNLISSSLRFPSIRNIQPRTDSRSLGKEYFSDSQSLNPVFDDSSDGSLYPFRFSSFDLNSTPSAMTRANLSKHIGSQFAPITPHQARTSGEGPVSSILPSSTNMTMDSKDMQDTGHAINGADICVIQQIQLAKDDSHATTSIQLQENHKPDKGQNQESELNKTPQQKQRRKKHRPKVVIEGQPKRTPKPVTPKPAEQTPTGKRKYVRKNGVNKPTATPSELGTIGTDLKGETSGSNETPAGKRKYVRKKGVDNLTANPLNEATTGAAESDTVLPTRKSCRRSLNFDFEGQQKDESSSCGPSGYVKASQEHNYFSQCQGASTSQLRQGMEATESKSEMGAAYHLSSATNHVLKLLPSMPQEEDPRAAIISSSDPQSEDLRNQNKFTRGKCQIVFSDAAHDKESKTLQMMMNFDSHATSRSNYNSTCSSSPCSIQELEARGLKRQLSHKTTEFNRINAIGSCYNSLQAYLATLLQNNSDTSTIMQYPVAHKKKRSEQGHKSVVVVSTQSNTATEEFNGIDKSGPSPHVSRQPFPPEQPVPSKVYCSISSPQHDGASALSKVTEVGVTPDEPQNLQCSQGLSRIERLTEKRSNGSTQVHDLASLMETCKQVSPSIGATTSSGVALGFQILEQQHSCTESLAAATHVTKAKEKRSKRNSLGDSMPNIQTHHKNGNNFRGALQTRTRKNVSPIDAIVEQFGRLEINRESNQEEDREQKALFSYQMKYQGENALVLYQRDGTLVPFEDSYEYMRKRRPRPKVDLDDETTRVWKLLLENINNEGIDGTDAEKAKWWEEERRVFRGRADSFIARMHLVQGDRQFSRWKGSVLQSIVGVFLTQNVSDHLSSSAFMSLAARFPLRPESNMSQSHEERASVLTEEPEISLSDDADAIGWHRQELNQLSAHQVCMMLPDSDYERNKETLDSESSGISYDGNRSGNKSTGLSGSSRNGPYLHRESALHEPTSLFNELGADSIRNLRDSVDLFSSQNSVVSSQNSVGESIVQTVGSIEPASESFEEETTAGVNSNLCSGSASFLRLLQMANTNMLDGVHHWGSSMISAAKVAPHQSTAAQEERHYNASQGHNRFHNVPNEKELRAEQSESLSQSPQAACKRTRTINIDELPKYKGDNDDFINLPQTEVTWRIEVQESNVDPVTHIQEKSNILQKQQRSPSVSEKISNFSARTTKPDNQSKPEKIVMSNLNESNSMNELVEGARTSKAKRAKTAKDKNDAVDWDSLRRQAQVDGIKRERTADTIDSVDWEAVRCADVDEIANTIKERGMNNMLAERIKDFLDRLVREHGSLDLEWLRDVPPDKAKEYLLSIRGLGLKSVECVRLLTLHHLAFPVDTNVGRIAVRLGWVPLQPLPESLQLHLLEMYPVLESIQKYLWPRLCKLDQRTLYELHYQMITFGKVFCSKSKPNCNACPMRGECRHFASAFASARLALPAPEEKGIVAATDDCANNQNLAGNLNLRQLHLPQAQLEAHSEISKEPIIEMPATPEPIIEVPATPEPDMTVTQVAENDIEDTLYDDPDEIPTIKLNMEKFAENVEEIVKSMELQECEMSKALVTLSPQAASIPMPKLKNISRLRTEHLVYELPDGHPLLKELDRREPDDPCKYLLAIWAPGETASSIQPPEKQCSFQESGKLCDNQTCFSCNSIRETNTQTVRGTLLIPCRTAMRGSFPLNGTYFQVNEVFADHESSLNPIDVPRDWLWHLPRRTVYFGTSIPTIFKGLSTEDIQQCFWRGFVCVRGFDRKTRAPRPLMARLHFPASKLNRTRDRTDKN